MIAMKSEPGRQFTCSSGHGYIADASGIIRDVQAEDIGEMKSAGAGYAVLPATVTLKAEPGRQFHFMGAIHTSDARGLISGVPFDFAVTQIKTGECREATDADLVAPEVVAPAAPEAPAADEATPDPHVEPIPAVDPDDDHAPE